jgi:hypothetical protein
MITLNKLHALKLVTLCTALAPLNAKLFVQDFYRDDIDTIHQSIEKSNVAYKNAIDLLHAVRSNDIDTVHRLIDAHTDVNYVATRTECTGLLPDNYDPSIPYNFSHTYTEDALGIALSGTHLEIGELLIKAGARDNTDEINFLCNHDQLSDNQQKLIIMAIQAKATNIINLAASFKSARAHQHATIVESIQTAYEKLSAEEKETCLIDAVKKQNLDAVNALLDAGANPNAISKKETDLAGGLLWSNGYHSTKTETFPVIAIAIEDANFELVQTLIKHGADVNATTITEIRQGAGGCLSLKETWFKNTSTTTPLIALAIKANDSAPAIVEALITAGAKVEGQAEKEVFSESRFIGGYASTEATPTKSTTTITTPLLILAVESGNQNIVDVVLHHKADIHQGRRFKVQVNDGKPTNYHGESPLLCAVELHNIGLHNIGLINKLKAAGAQ